MKARQIMVVPLIGLLLVLAQARVTSPAIFERPSQILVLAKTSANPITISSMSRSLPDNTYTSGYSLPPNTVFLLTKVSMNFTTTDTSYTGDVLFTIGDYYRFRLTIPGSAPGFIGLNENLPLGIPISDLSKQILIYQYGDSTQTPVAGSISIRLFGYTAPNN